MSGKGGDNWNQYLLPGPVQLWVLFLSHCLFYFGSFLFVYFALIDDIAWMERAHGLIYTLSFKIDQPLLEPSLNLGSGPEVGKDVCSRKASDYQMIALKWPQIAQAVFIYT